MEHSLVNDTDGKTEVIGGKGSTVSLCPPHIPCGLAWDRTQASTWRDE